MHQKQHCFLLIATLESVTLFLFTQRNHYQCTRNVARYGDSASPYTLSRMKGFPPPLHGYYRFRLDLYLDHLIPLYLTDDTRLTDTAKSKARERGLLTFPYLRSDTLVD